MTRGLGGHSPANVAYYLKGIDFPTDRQGLLEHAEDNGAVPDVLDEIEHMPRMEYQSMADVMKGYGQQHEGSRSYQNERRGRGYDQDYDRGDDYRSGGRSRQRGYDEDERYGRHGSGNYSGDYYEEGYGRRGMQGDGGRRRRYGGGY